MRSILALMRIRSEIASVIRSINSMGCETLPGMRDLTLLVWDQIAQPGLHLPPISEGVEVGSGDLMDTPTRLYDLPQNHFCGRS